MRSAPCAWAPSHPLHAMPPRITRNSHRPRASDRTMVDLEHQFGLPLFRTRWHRHHPRRKLMSMGNRPSFSRQAQLQWAGSRETNLASGRGRTFFLTSLFIELIEPCPGPRTNPGPGYGGVGTFPVPIAIPDTSLTHSLPSNKLKTLHIETTLWQTPSTSNFLTGP